MGRDAKNARNANFQHSAATVSRLIFQENSVKDNSKGTMGKTGKSGKVEERANLFKRTEKRGG